MSRQEINDTRLAHSRLSGECQFNIIFLGVIRSLKKTRLPLVGALDGRELNFVWRNPVEDKPSNALISSNSFENQMFAACSTASRTVQQSHHINIILYFIQPATCTSSGLSKFPLSPYLFRPRNCFLPILFRMPRITAWKARRQRAPADVHSSLSGLAHSRNLRLDSDRASLEL